MSFECPKQPKIFIDSWVDARTKFWQPRPSTDVKTFYLTSKKNIRMKKDSKIDLMKTCAKSMTGNSWVGFASTRPQSISLWCLRVRSLSPSLSCSLSISLFTLKGTNTYSPPSQSLSQTHSWECESLSEYLCAYGHVHVCVCVCVREREREKVVESQCHILERPSIYIRRNRLWIFESGTHTPDLRPGLKNPTRISDLSSVESCPVSY